MNVHTRSVGGSLTEYENHIRADRRGQERHCRPRRHAARTPFAPAEGERQDPPLLRSAELHVQEAEPDRLRTAGRRRQGESRDRELPQVQVALRTARRAVDRGVKTEVGEKKEADSLLDGPEVTQVAHVSPQSSGSEVR